ncbi:MAG TPA: HD domain-containing phosphohydrolase [Solirubrobacteraceae bacterium]|nr:HD domain-containing phosphohydrolase [Solirubrobacteraceae bacterium]
MRLTLLSRAGGLTLARDLPPTGPGKIPLLRRGSVVTPRYQAALAEHGFQAVWVEDALSAGIEPEELLPEPVRAATAARVASGLDHARAALGGGGALAPHALKDLQDVVALIAGSIRDSPGAALCLGDLAAADQYTHRHSVNVTALGLHLARVHWRREGWVDHRGQRRWDRLDRRLAVLGLGLLLHDIGKMAVPAEVLDKPGPLDAAEWELMKTHPTAGAALLETAAISPLVRSVIRDHHERVDGSGYPRGLAGERLGEMPRLAAVADVYDAITSERPYAAAAPPHVGVSAITDGSGTAFDPGVVASFQRVVMPYPVGTEVELHDGLIGVVAHVDEGRPYEPLVRFAGGERRIDLRGHAG